MKRKLNNEVSEKYSLVGTPAGRRSFDKFGVIDFDTLTLKEADMLYNSGFKYLKLKSSKPKAKK